MRITIEIPDEQLPEQFREDPAIPGGNRENLLGFLRECLINPQYMKRVAHLVKTQCDENLDVLESATRAWIEAETALGELMMKNVNLET